MTTTKLRIAVAGAGLIGRVHAELIADSGECELAAIADPAAAADDLAANFDVTRYDTLPELLDADPPDGVVVATPNAMHVSQALTCIEAGVPMLIEKPVAAEVAEGERLLRALDNNDVPAIVGHHRAHSPIIALARQAIDDGLLGQLVAVTGTALFYKPDDYFDAGPWRTRPGGGPILINLIHEIDNLRRLCGEIVSVQALKSSARRNFAVEDSAAIGMRFASGCLGTFLLSDVAASGRSWEQTSQENKAYPTYPDEDCYHIAGTLGSLSVPTMRLRCHADATDASWWNAFATTTLELRREDPLKRQLRHFCALIRGEEKAMVTVRDGLQNLRVVEAINQAGDAGRTVDLN